MTRIPNKVRLFIHKRFSSGTVIQWTASRDIDWQGKKHSGRLRIKLALLKPDSIDCFGLHYFIGNTRVHLFIIIRIPFCFLAFSHIVLPRCTIGRAGVSLWQERPAPDNGCQRVDFFTSTRSHPTHPGRWLIYQRGITTSRLQGRWSDMTVIKFLFWWHFVHSINQYFTLVMTVRSRTVLNEGCMTVFHESCYMVLQVSNLQLTSFCGKVWFSSNRVSQP